MTWQTKKLDDACDVVYGTRVVNKRDGGSKFPVYGGGGATFFMDEYNREDCMVVARFAMSEKCTRFVSGKFFLNDSGLTVLPKSSKEILQEFLDYQLISLNDHIYSLSRGSAQKNLDLPAFKKIEISYPEPLPEQHRIVKILDEVFADVAKAKANAEKNLQNAKELFESYLQSVFAYPGKDWEEKNLKDLTSKIGSGATPRGGKGSYHKEGISLVRSMNVHDRKFVEKNLAFINDKQAGELSNVSLEKDDVLLNITGASVARCCIFPEKYLPARVNQHVSIIRAKPEVVNSHFLNYLLTTKSYKDQLLGIGEQGATRQALTKAQLEEFIISLPKSLSEQKSIVKKLDALSAETKKLEKIYQQKLADLEELKKSVLKKAFSGDL